MSTPLCYPRMRVSRIRKTQVPPKPEKVMQTVGMFNAVESNPVSPQKTENAGMYEQGCIVSGLVRNGVCVCSSGAVLSRKPPRSTGVLFRVPIGGLKHGQLSGSHGQAALFSAGDTGSEHGQCVRGISNVGAERDKGGASAGSHQGATSFTSLPGFGLYCCSCAIITWAEHSWTGRAENFQRFVVFLFCQKMTREVQSCNVHSAFQA